MTMSASSLLVKNQRYRFADWYLMSAYQCPLDLVDTRLQKNWLAERANVALEFEPAFVQKLDV